jgi:hypothetical protein
MTMNTHCPINLLTTQNPVLILKVPAPSRHQRAFLRSELEHISNVAADTTENGRYRELIEGYCLICMDELQPSENLVWCEAACGKSDHR